MESIDLKSDENSIVDNQIVYTFVAVKNFVSLTVLSEKEHQLEIHVREQTVPNTYFAIVAKRME